MSIGIALILAAAVVFVAALFIYGLKHWLPWAALMVGGFASGFTESE